jgi:hypothetical protein
MRTVQGIRGVLCVWMVCMCAVLATERAGADDESVDVAPAAVVVVPADPDDAQIAFAAAELRKHLALVLNTNVPLAAVPAAAPGSYPFHVGIAAPGGAPDAYAPEEARWQIERAAAYLSTHERGYGRGGLFAVYAFLEQQLGVRWIEPGDRGIGFTPRDQLTLTLGSFSWRPELALRKLRVGIRASHPPTLPAEISAFGEFVLSPEAHAQRAEDERVWTLRMRMGSHDYPAYGHAFNDWWDRFSESHPAYFAQNRWGLREPEQRQAPGDGNPAVVEQVIADWRPRQARIRWVNACENDMPMGFCRCADCLTLDGRSPDAELGDYVTDLSDRYVAFTNQVARAARTIRPDAGAVLYAYQHGVAEAPPKRVRVDPNVVVAVVPSRRPSVHCPPQSAALLRDHCHSDGFRKAGVRELQARACGRGYRLRLRSDDGLLADQRYGRLHPGEGDLGARPVVRLLGGPLLLSFRPRG